MVVSRGTPLPLFLSLSVSFKEKKKVISRIVRRSMDLRSFFFAMWIERREWNARELLHAIPTHPPVSNPIRRRFRGGKQDVESSCPASNVLSIRYARDICTRCWYPGADYYPPTEEYPGRRLRFHRMNGKERERERDPLFRSAGNFSRARRLLNGGFV